MSGTTKAPPVSAWRSPAQLRRDARFHRLRAANAWTDADRADELERAAVCEQQAEEQEARARVSEERNQGRRHP